MDGVCATQAGGRERGKGLCWWWWVGGVIGVGRGRENVKVVGSGDFLLF